MTEEMREKIPAAVALGLEAPAEAPDEAPEELRVVVNLDKLTIGDLELLDRATNNELPMSELIDLLDQCVEGDVRAMPLPLMGDIMKAITKEIGILGNPEVGGKN